MKDQWIGSNVDLTMLGKSVVQFFADNQFETRLAEKKDDFRILATDPLFRLRVNIYGRPDDFKVEFVPNAKSRGFSLSMMIGYITSLFGGGGFLLRDVKLQESLNTLEGLFWEFMDKQVAELTNSAR